MDPNRRHCEVLGLRRIFFLSPFPINVSTHTQQTRLGSNKRTEGRRDITVLHRLDHHTYIILSKIYIFVHLRVL
jgi:hypothetical protein